MSALCTITHVTFAVCWMNLMMPTVMETKQLFKLFVIVVCALSNEAFESRSPNNLVVFQELVKGSGVTILM